MTQHLIVLLYGQHAADLHRNGQQLTLTYLPDYRAAPDPTPVSLAMPVAIERHHTPVVEPWLWGLLPDNPDVLSRWAREYQVSARNVFALLSHVGEDCAGAVQFVRPERLDGLGEGGVRWLAEADIADLLRQLKQDPTAWHRETATGQFSLAGAQAKTALHFDSGRWGLPTGIVPTTHIFKPAIEGRSDHDLNEHLCMRAARLAGLPAATSHVSTFAGERVIVVERYDRRRTADGLVRIHQEDLCQALGRHPDAKYQADGGPSPADIAALFRRSVPRRKAAQLTRAFTDALAYNWIIAGTDAHAKNSSVMLLRREVRLAPLYDLASALPYQDLRHNPRLAMEIGGAYKTGSIGRSNWEALAREVQLEPEHVIGRAIELATRLPGAFRQAAADPAVRELGSPLPDELVTHITERSANCLSRLAQPGPSATPPNTASAADTGSAPLPAGGAWSAAGAARLLAELPPAQVRLLLATAAAGRLSAADARAALGRPERSTLRGVVTSISRARTRLLRQGLLPDGTPHPIRTLYAGGPRSVGFEMDPATAAAFLADRSEAAGD